MSEINSIANGTFTIGSTSATSFEAGPGISITQPSEGTVRIANDETVLWSGTRTSACTLSENAYNFDRIRLYLHLGMDERPRPIIELKPNTNMMTLFPKGGGTVWWSWVRYTLNSDGKNLVAEASKCFNFGSVTSTTWSNPSIAVNSDEDINAITQVIGINRISGGNE